MASGPLNGVRVLEFGQIFAAPLGCQMLSDLGAEVIKVEPLRAVRPDIVYLDNTAFGRKGELAERPGYDLVAQALSGVMAAIGKTGPGGEPLGVLSPPFLDTTTAYAIVGGVCAALYHRAMTGEGQLVETSLLINALTSTRAPSSPTRLRTRQNEPPSSWARDIARSRNTPYAELVERGRISPTVQGVYYRCYVTSDGAVAVGALSASLRAKLRAVMPFEHNRDEPDYDVTNPAQQAIDRHLTYWMKDTFREHTSAYWEQYLSAGGVPVSRINFVQELLEHPQVVANDYVVEIEHELTGTQYVAAPPWKMSVTPPRIQGASPPLGRDTDAILAEAGYAANEIERLHREGVIT